MGCVVAGCALARPDKIQYIYLKDQGVYLRVIFKWRLSIYRQLTALSIIGFQGDSSLLLLKTGTITGLLAIRKIPNDS